MASQKTKDASKEIREGVARLILDLMEKDGLQWHQGFDRTMFVSRNPQTPTRYKGVNRAWLAFMLKERQLTDPRFCTFLQAQQAGWRVKKGSHGTLVECWQRKPYVMEDGKRRWLKKEEVSQYKKEDVFWPLCLVGTSNVFNFQDLEGPGAYIEDPGPQGYELADALEASSRCPVGNAAVQAACYRPASDEIVMPPRGAYADPDEYTSTLLHEMAHSTKVPLGRRTPDAFKSCSYAYEELCAEIASVFAGAELGLPVHTSAESHAAYLQSWLSACRSDSDAMDRALSEAQEIADYLIENLATYIAGTTTAA